MSLNLVQVNYLSQTGFPNGSGGRHDHQMAPPPHHQFSYRDFYIGLSLALLSSFFIGSSFILKKKGLLKLTGATTLPGSPKSNLRAAQGGYGYLKEWLWWSGLITMGVGELCNFAAYGFVPATLVTPLGALSVLISAILSAHFLDEKLNKIGKIGCFLTAIGSTVMVIHAPKEGDVKSLRDLLNRIQEIEFVCFTVASIIALLVLIFILTPRYGSKNILIYILICSLLGSFTVMSCKGLSIGIKEILNQSLSVSYLYTYLFGIILIVCIMVQMNYLNKALDLFNTAIVTTVYYVLFTLFVMVSSSVLFKELLNLSFEDFVGCMCGFSTIVCALCLIHFFKSSNNSDELISFDNMVSPYDYDEDMAIPTTSGLSNNVLSSHSSTSSNSSRTLDQYESGKGNKNDNYVSRNAGFASNPVTGYSTSGMMSRHVSVNETIKHDEFDINQPDNSLLKKSGILKNLYTFKPFRSNYKLLVNNDLDDTDQIKTVEEAASFLNAKTKYTTPSELPAQNFLPVSAAKSLSVGYHKSKVSRQTNADRNSLYYDSDEINNDQTSLSNSSMITLRS